MGEGLTSEARILTVNTGSFSLKVALYRVRYACETPELAARVERIGSRDGRLLLANADDEALGGASGEAPDREGVEVPDHASALAVVLKRLGLLGYAGPPAAVGHKVVHGGNRYSEPVEILPEVVGVLRGSYGRIRVVVVALVYLQVIARSCFGVVTYLHQASAGGDHETLTRALLTAVSAITFGAVPVPGEEDARDDQDPTCPQIDDADQGTVYDEQYGGTTHEHHARHDYSQPEHERYPSCSTTTAVP